jgi:hypothetical protein
MPISTLRRTAAQQTMALTKIRPITRPKSGFENSLLCGCVANSGMKANAKSGSHSFTYQGRLIAWMNRRLTYHIALRQPPDLPFTD